MEILFVSSNLNKVRVMQGLLGRPLRHVHLQLPEIQALSVHEVIEGKARAAFDQVGRPLLVEDTSLAFHAWNGLPGALMSWFLDSVGNDGLCRMLDGFEERGATAETCLGYFDGHEFRSFSGTLQGTIARQPRGDNGYGWDPLFIPAGKEKTLAEMTDEEKAALGSMRRQAVLRFGEFLDSVRD